MRPDILNDRVGIVFVSRYRTQNDNNIWVQYIKKHANTRDIECVNYYNALTIDLKYHIHLISYQDIRHTNVMNVI